METKPDATPEEQAAATAAEADAQKAAEAKKATDAAKTPEQLQAELDGAQARIHELNKENEKRRKAQEALEAQQKEAEEKRLAEQGEFKTLAEQRTAERDAATAELVAANDRLARYDTLLAADIDARIKAWPDEVKSLIPNGEGVDALSRLERITELEPLATRLMKAQAPGGNGAGPVASGMAPADVQAAQAAQRSITRRALG